MIRHLRVLSGVILLSLNPYFVFAQEPAQNPPQAARVKQPLATVCAVAQFGDPKVPGTPLFPTSTSALVQDAHGNIYSTTADGGKLRRGAAYKVSPDGQMTVLYDFGQPLKNFPKKDPKDPDVYLTGPSGGLVKYGKDKFLGVSGGGELKVGAIFSIPASGGEPTIVYSFRNGYPTRKLNPGEKDYTEQEKLDWAAGYPWAAPVMLGGGYYGVTPYANNQRYGVFYSLSGGYSGKYFFRGENGYKPLFLVAGRNGKLYGGTAHGTNKDTAYMGTVFQADPGGGVSLLYEGTRTTGYGPASIVYGSDDQLYVAMAGGGYGGGYGLGVIAKIDPATKTYEIIHYFEGKDKGWRPSSLVEGPDRKLYGTTLGGGHCGMFFSLSRDGKDYHIMYTFDHARVGHRPHGPLLVDNSGKYFYGTTYQVSEFGGGSLYRVDPGFVRPYPADPGRRWCCSLAQSPGSGYSGGSLDPSELAGHSYGATDSWTNLFDIKDIRDPVGFVATAYGGLVDIGHVRYMADVTKYVYDLLIQGEYMIPLFEGNAEVINPPKDQYAAVQLAGAIAYFEGWAHEFGTWKTTLLDFSRPTWVETPQDFSAFSPEDLSSNLLGIEVGKRAIIDSCAKDFNKAMDEQLAKMMTELMAQPKDVTAKIREDLEQSNFNSDTKGKWFKELGTSEALIRRNFEPWPWRVVEDKSNYTSPIFNVNWVWNQQANFKYQMKKRVVGYNMDLTSYNMKAASAALKKDWIEKDKGLATWP